MEKTFSFTKCVVVEEGSIIYQKGEQILRTTIETEDPERHTKLAKVTCDLLNKWHDKGMRDKTAKKEGRRNVDFDEEWLDALLSRAADHDSLSVDNQAFVSDMTDRLGKYGARTLISPAQMTYLKIIEDKVM